MHFKVTLLLFVILSTSVFSKQPYRKLAEHTLLNGDQLTEYRLQNGLRVLLVPRHQAKVLTYQIWFDVGSIDEKLDFRIRKTGLAHLFEHMMFRGTTKVPDGKFDEIISRIGGVNQNATTWYHRTNYYESIPSNKLETVMAIESDRMKNLELTRKIFEKEKGAVIGELRRANDSPTRFANNELMRLIFKEAPYRYTVLGSEKEIKGFTLKQANYFYKTFYAPNNGTIIMVGSFDNGDTMDLIHKYYGAMKPQPIPKAVVPKEPPQTKPRKRERTHKQATSEVLLIGYRGASINSPDIVPLSLLSDHLATGKEARLRKVLVDKGIAVSASAYPSNKPDVFEFFVQMAEGQPASRAIGIINREINALKEKLISSQDFS